MYVKDYYHKEHLLKPSDNVGVARQTYKSEDGFLYIYYTDVATFG